MDWRKKGKIIKGGDRKTVLYVYNHFKSKYPEKSDTAIVKETCEATHTSQASFYRIRKELRKGPLKTPTKKRTPIQYSSSRKVKYNEFVRSAIRRKVHSFFLRNIPPTIKLVLTEVNNDDDLPNFKWTTFYRLVLEIGFQFEKRGNKALLIERNDIILWRHSYLRKIRKFRAEGRPILYLDETWINVGHTVPKVWRDKSIKTPKDALLAGLSTGLKNPTARGPRFVILHAGGGNGFVPNAKLVFLAKKNTADYHDEMDSARFETWFEEQLLPNIPPGAVVVMDNAPYHSRKKEKVPTTAWKREDIKNWLESKHLEIPDDSLKRELLDIVDRVRSQFSAYAIDSLAEERGVVVCRLPPYHCELNPIEMVWSQIKRHVGQHNVQFKANLISGLIDDAFVAVSEQQWANYCRHVQGVEEEMWAADRLQDDIEPFIVRLTSSSSNSSGDNSTTDSTDESNVDSTRDQQELMEGVEPLPE